MTNMLQFNNFGAKHHANITASLARRLEVARAANNFQLVKALEQERWQIEGGSVIKASQSLIARLRKIWHHLVAAIANSDKLQVWQTDDSYGIRWWNAYDPHTGKSVCTDSESEMRQWIEENYQEE